jgi:hypothetical protein
MSYDSSKSIVLRVVEKSSGSGNPDFTFMDALHALLYGLQL